MQSTNPAPLSTLSRPLIRLICTFGDWNMASCSKYFAEISSTVFFNELHWPLFNYLTQDMDATQKSQTYPFLNQNPPVTTQQNIRAINLNLYANLSAEAQSSFLHAQFAARPQLFNITYFLQPLLQDAMNFDLTLALQINERCTAAMRRNVFRYCLNRMNELDINSPVRTNLSSFGSELKKIMPAADVTPIVLSTLVKQGRSSAYLESLTPMTEVDHYAALQDANGKSLIHLGIAGGHWKYRDFAFFRSHTALESASHLVTCFLENKRLDYAKSMDPCHKDFAKEFVGYFKSHDDQKFLVQQWNALMAEYSPFEFGRHHEFFSLVDCFTDIAQYYFAKDFPEENAPIIEMSLADQITKLLADLHQKFYHLESALNILKYQGQWGFFCRYKDTMLSQDQLFVVSQVIKAKGVSPDGFIPDAPRWVKYRDWLLAVLTDAKSRTTQWILLCKDFQPRMRKMSSASEVTKQFKEKRIYVSKSLELRHSPADSKGPGM